MNHLHDRVAALIDHQLSPGAQRRALEHVARCQACRAAVDAERRTRAALAGSDAVAPPADLVARLLALGGPQGPLRPRDGHLPGTPRAPALPGPRADRSARWALATAEAPPASVQPEPAAHPEPSVRSRAATRLRRPATRPRPPAPTRRRRLPRGTSAVRRRAAVAVAGTVSLTAVGLLATGLLGGALGVPDAEPLVGRLAVERAGRSVEAPVVTTVARLSAPGGPRQPTATP